MIQFFKKNKNYDSNNILKTNIIIVTTDKDERIWKQYEHKNLEYRWYKIDNKNKFKEKTKVARKKENFKEKK